MKKKKQITYYRTLVVARSNRRRIRGIGDNALYKSTFYLLYLLIVVVTAALVVERWAVAGGQRTRLTVSDSE